MSLLEKLEAAQRSQDALAALGVNAIGATIDVAGSATEGDMAGRRVVLAGTNNYLGLTFDRECVEAAVDALLKNGAQGDHWTLISSAQGHHLARITVQHDAVVPTLERVRSRLISDWERYAADRQIADQTHHIAQQYQVRLALSDHYLDLMAQDLPRNPFPDSVVDAH